MCVTQLKLGLCLAPQAWVCCVLCFLLQTSWWSNWTIVLSAHDNRLALRRLQHSAGKQLLHHTCDHCSPSQMLCFHNTVQ